jgi:type I restriction enzyme, S subunit
MNSAHLLTYFDRISDAPDAIPRLRRFILDLAVRGKLVEQNLKDGSAFELLNQIQVERECLVKARKIKTPRELEVGEREDEPFALPSQWTWCRLSDVGAIIGGGTPPSEDLDNFTAGGSGIAWLTPADLGKKPGLYVAHGSRDLTPKGLRSSSATVMPKGSVLFTSRAPIGYLAIATNEISTNQGFKSVIPYIMDCNLYIALYFRAFGKWIDSKASGTTFREVPGKIISNLPFPLPPLAEQYRIVAKVDELMALCDWLERAKAEQEDKRDRLAAASLHSLVSSADTPTFCDHVSFYLNQVPSLTTRLEHIKQLRQAVLDLAVRGRLVPQDPNDQPVAEALSVSDRTRQATAKEDHRADAGRQVLLAGDSRWNVPTSWEWRGLADLVLFIDYRGQTPNKVHQGVRLITAKNVKKGFINISPEEFLSESDYERWMTRGLPKEGDVLFTTEAPVGNAAVVCLHERFALAQRVICFRRYGSLDPDFLMLQLLSKEFQSILSKTETGLTAKGIKAAKLKRLPIAVPPPAEQCRIAAKVNELMAICDQLEAQLTTAQTESRSLLEAVLHEALNNDPPKAMSDD